MPPSLMACLVAQQTKAQAAEKKKKLLWSGNRSGEAAAATWATADLGDASRKEKFLKLMGAKPAEATRAEPKLNTAETQQKMFQELEREYMAGLGQGTSRNGLGFQ